MPSAVFHLSRYRFLAAALAASVALHAAVLFSIPAPPQMAESAPQPFSAELLPPPPAPAPLEAKRPEPPKPVPARPKPRRHAAAKVRKPAPLPPPPAPALLAAAQPSTDLVAVPPPAPAAAPEPDAVALAEPVIPWIAPRTAPVPEPDLFPMEGLPERLSIDYRLTAGLLDAHATYRWRRKGDVYRITGEGEAVGFFRLFMEGQIFQESEGTITAAGLRPERFLEKRSGREDEGLEFDWLKHTVTLERGDDRKTAPLAGDTVDWLTMIFELAHVPPRARGAGLNLHVYTQRKLYDFDLKVLGLEEIEIPLGKVRALHLRHVDPDDGRTIDVWLGVDQHYLPVKLRYPVAKMQLMVEQSAARITER
ncbi:MAG TPA: DUF3108 domain-containing protein [Usitatibacter sp.]|nr:DUF3108 domain-containing protein [Usitatibacter sp.]